MAKHAMKPQYGAQGQTQKGRMAEMNDYEGGAPGQKTTGTQNKPVKPQDGAQGQEEAGKLRYG